MCLSRARIVNADFRAAFGIAVGVRGVVHHGDGEGDDCVGGIGVVAAGAGAGCVVGHVAYVGGGEGNGDCEGEGGADFHCEDVGIWVLDRCSIFTLAVVCCCYCYYCVGGSFCVCSHVTEEQKERVGEAAI